MKYIPQSKIELKAMACHSSRSWDPPTLVHVPNPVNAQLNCTLREAMPSPACLSMCHFSETTQKNGQPLRGRSVLLKALQTCRVEAVFQLQQHPGADTALVSCLLRCPG